MAKNRISISGAERLSKGLRKYVKETPFVIEQLAEQAGREVLVEGFKQIAKVRGNIATEEFIDSLFIKASRTRANFVTVSLESNWEFFEDFMEGSIERYEDKFDDFVEWIMIKNGSPYEEARSLAGYLFFGPDSGFDDEQGVFVHKGERNNSRELPPEYQYPEPEIGGVSSSVFEEYFIRFRELLNQSDRSVPF